MRQIKPRWGWYELVGGLIMLAAVGCSNPLLPPHLYVLPTEQMGGQLGYYCKDTNTIYLAPGADERVLAHELGHFYGQTGEDFQTWAEVYR